MKQGTGDVIYMYYIKMIAFLYFVYKNIIENKQNGFI